MVAITISRQYGSGGRKVALKVASELKYDIFDKRLMVDIARDMGMSETELVDFSEENYEVRGFFDNLFGGGRNVATVSTRTRDGDGTEQKIFRKLDEQEAINLVRASVRTAYKRKNVVIVGRGGQHILKNELDVFHVRIVASVKTRRERLVEIEGHKSYETVPIIAERDKANREYHHRFYDADLNDPQMYHMVLNTGKLSTDHAVELILATYKQFLETIAIPAMA